MNCSLVVPESGRSLAPIQTGSGGVFGPPTGAPSGAPLDTDGVNSSHEGNPASVEAYRERLRLRGFLWLVSSDRAVSACGRCRQRRKGSDHAEPVTVKVGPSGVGLSGLQRCAKVWICPVCSVAVWGERSMEIGMLAAAHVAAGGRILFVTLTTRHHVPDRLDGLVGYLRAGWDGVVKGRAGLALVDALGVAGYVRSMEINYGGNGWHPHYHVAFFVGGDVTKEQADRVIGEAFDRWSRAVVKAGGKVPLEQAQDVRLFGAADSDDLAKYLTKTLIDSGRSGSGSARARVDRTSAAEVGERLGRELTQGQRKRARRFFGTRPARALLVDALTDGDAEALELWHEYEKATHRVRGISWSRGLRAKYGLGAERTEQEIVDDDRGGVPVMVLTNAGVARLIGWPELLADMGQAYRAGDYMGLRNFMDTNGIGYEEIGK